MVDAVPCRPITGWPMLVTLRDRPEIDVEPAGPPPPVVPYEVRCPPGGAPSPPPPSPVPPSPSSPLVTRTAKVAHAAVVTLPARKPDPITVPVESYRVTITDRFRSPAPDASTPSVSVLLPAGIG